MKCDQKIIWQPVGYDQGKLTSQFFAYTVQANEILLHGTRGYGKTITQLMRFRKYVGRGYGSYLKGIVIDREYKHLQDIVTQSKRFFPNIGLKPRFINSPTEYKWIWPTGEELLFRHLAQPKDYDSVHGMEFTHILFNEISKHPTDELYKLILSTNRSSFIPKKHTLVRTDRHGNLLQKKDGTPLYDTPDGHIAPPIPLEVISTTNPSGAGFNWVKRRFITGYESGKIYETVEDVEGLVVKRKRISIFGTWKENLQRDGGYLPDNYIASLKEACRGNRNLEKAWIEGSWDITAGGMFDDLWSNDVHILHPFRVPLGWRITRGFDWGSSHPFYVGWFARSNGEDVCLPNGMRWSVPRDTLFLISEWYGTEGIGTNKGLRMSAADVAVGILERDLKIKKHILHPTAHILAGPADNQINNSIDISQPSIAKNMADKGVFWTESNKSTGSRKLGWELIRERLQCSLMGEGAGLYVFNTCRGFLETFPTLPMDKKKLDDVDTNAEDHPADVIRYMCLDGVRTITTGKVIGSF